MYSQQNPYFIPNQAQQPNPQYPNPAFQQQTVPQQHINQNPVYNSCPQQQVFYPQQQIPYTQSQNYIPMQSQNQPQLPTNTFQPARPTKQKRSAANIILNFVVLPLVILSFIIGAFVIGIALGNNSTDKTDFNQVVELVETYFNGEYDKDTAEYYAINGYLGSLEDDYAFYLTEEQYQKLADSQEGEKVIIGIEFGFTEDDKVYISGFDKDGKAKDSGLKINDFIVSIDNEKIENYNDYANFARSNVFEDGQMVPVVVDRNGEIITVTIEAKKVDIPLCEFKMYSDVAYIHLYSFTDTSAEKFKNIMEEINSNPNCKGIILDLRDNGGGSVTALESIAGSFLKKEQLIAKFKYKKISEDIKPSQNDTYTDLPLVVLVNGNSASASECLTGALKCHKRATIIGTQTFGKGIGQSTFLCDNGGYVQFTSLEYFLPDGSSIHKVGIEPNIVIEMSDEIEFLTDDDIQFSEALKKIK